MSDNTKAKDKPVPKEPIPVSGHLQPEISPIEPDHTNLDEDPGQSPAEPKRIYANQMDIDSDLFKLEVAQMKKKHEL